MKILFRQPKQTLYIFLGVFFVALTVVGLLPSKKVYAADNKVPTTTLAWIDQAKSAAVSSNDVRFEALGYLCLNNDKPFTGNGKNVEVNGQAKPDDKDTKTKSYVSYTFPQIPVDGNPKQWCQGSSAGNMASYAWVTRYPSGNNYALIQLPCYGKDKGNDNMPTDPKVQVVTSTMTNEGDPGCIWMGHIGSDGKVANNEIEKPRIKQILVDTTKANTGTTDGNGDDTETKDNCLIQNWAFKWAACPILEYVIGSTTDKTENNGILGYMQSKMTTWLVGDADTFDTSSGKAGASYYKAWSSFRTIGVSLIIIAGIVMVVAQAVGSSVIDAYAVRKIAPRLIAYAIIMTLSWWLLKWLYQFFDNLTVWVASIISAPFSDLKAAPLDGTAMFTAALGVFAAIAAINPPIVFTYVLTFLTAVFVAWLILALRQMLLIFLLLISPLAIASFILPGTKKFGDFWWNGTVSLCLMGPAIGAAIVFGQIIPNIFVTPQNADQFDKFGVIRLGAPFIGYGSTAFIATRLSGLAGTITGMTNDKAKGLFDRVSNKRSEMRSKRFNDMAKGQAWSNNNVVGKGLNKFTRGAALAGSVAANKPTAFLRKSSYQNGGIFSAASDQALRAHAGELQKDPRWGAIQNNDGALRAATYRDDKTALREMTEFYAQQNMAKGKSRTEAYAEAQQSAQNDIAALHATGLERSAGLQYAAAIGMAATGTGIDDYMDQAALVSRVSGGNEARRKALAGDINFTNKQGKRHADLAAGFGNIDKAAAGYADYQRNLAIAQSSTADQATRAAAAKEVTKYENMINDHGVDAARGASMHDLAGDKTATHKNTAKVLNQALERHIDTLRDTTASKDARDKAAVEVGNIVAQMNNMKSTIPMFAAAANSAAMHEHGLRSADQNMQIVNSLTQKTIKQTVDIKDANGTVVGQQIHEVPNQQYNETLARTMREQVTPRSDPTDPRNYGQAA